MLPAPPGPPQTLALTLVYLCVTILKIFRMCCLIAAPFNPSCTPGDLYLVLLSLLHANKKKDEEDFLTGRDVAGTDTDHSITDCNNPDRRLIGWDAASCVFISRRGRCRLLSCHVLDGSRRCQYCFNTLIGYMWKDLFQSDTSVA